MLLLPFILLSLGSCTPGAEDSHGSHPASISSSSSPLIDGTEYDYDVQELDCSRDGLNIYGSIYLPDREGEAPAIILSHSAGLNSDSMVPYAERFASMGFVSVIFDFCGGSPSSRSDLDPVDMTVFTEVDDLAAVYETVSSMALVDDGNIFLFGTSQGGLVSSIFASQNPSLVRGMILFYPAFNIPELITSMYAGKEIPDVIDSGFVVSGRAYIETLIDFDIYALMADYPNPVQIVAGSADFIVSPSYQERAVEAFPDAQLGMIEGATHGFNIENYSFFGDYDDEAFAFVDDFLSGF